MLVWDITYAQSPEVLPLFRAVVMLATVSGDCFKLFIGQGLGNSILDTLRGLLQYLHPLAASVTKRLVALLDILISLHVHSHAHPFLEKVVKILLNHLANLSKEPTNLTEHLGGAVMRLNEESREKTQFATLGHRWTCRLVEAILKLACATCNFLPDQQAALGRALAALLTKQDCARDEKGKLPESEGREEVLIPSVALYVQQFLLSTDTNRLRVSVQDDIDVVDHRIARATGQAAGLINMQFDPMLTDPFLQLEGDGRVVSKKSDYGWKVAMCNVGLSYGQHSWEYRLSHSSASLNNFESKKMRLIIGISDLPLGSTDIDVGVNGTVGSYLWCVQQNEVSCLHLLIHRSRITMQCHRREIVLS